MISMAFYHLAIVEILEKYMVIFLTTVILSHNRTIFSPP